jgi:hypothetical protein
MHESREMSDDIIHMRGFPKASYRWIVEKGNLNGTIQSYF